MRTGRIKARTITVANNPKKRYGQVNPDARIAVKTPAVNNGIPTPANRSISRGDTGASPHKGIRLPEFSRRVRTTDIA
jgi:hypothetical protein